MTSNGLEKKKNVYIYAVLILPGSAKLKNDHVKKKKDWWHSG